MNAGAVSLVFYVLILLAIAADACTHAGASSSAAASSAGQGEAQGAGAGRASLRRGPRHLGVSVTPAADGGTPTFTLDIDDGAEELDTSADAAADAGALATLDAGVGAVAPEAPAPFFSTVRLVIFAVLGALILGALVARKAGLL